MGCLPLEGFHETRRSPASLRPPAPSLTVGAGGGEEPGEGYGVSRLDQIPIRIGTGGNGGNRGLLFSVISVCSCAGSPVCFSHSSNLPLFLYILRVEFQLVSNYDPRGDQPQAIEALMKSIRAGNKFQTLLGVTGSGKTFTMANVIQQLQRPTLVISHNQTLAAQLYAEFKSFFPQNAVEYFVSYYDYYQPEAYIPRTDTYIEKDSSINEEIDRMRHSATRAILERDDVIVVASVSCIYGIGSVETYSA